MEYATGGIVKAPTEDGIINPSKILEPVIDYYIDTEIQKIVEEVFWDVVLSPPFSHKLWNELVMEANGFSRIN